MKRSGSARKSDRRKRSDQSRRQLDSRLKSRRDRFISQLKDKEYANSQELLSVLQELGVDRVKFEFDCDESGIQTYALEVFWDPSEVTGSMVQKQDNPQFYAQIVQPFKDWYDAEGVDGSAAGRAEWLVREFRFRISGYETSPKYFEVSQPLVS